LIDLADFDLLWFGFFSLRQDHFKNSVLIGGVHLAGVHMRRKRDAATERPYVALGALGFFTIVALTFALAADRQCSVVQRNVDVFLTHSRQLDYRDVVVAPLVEIECRRPTGKQLAGPSKTRRERHSKERVQLVSQITPAIRRRP